MRMLMTPQTSSIQFCTQLMNSNRHAQKVSRRPQSRDASRDASRDVLCSIERRVSGRALESASSDDRSACPFFVHCLCSQVAAIHTHRSKARQTAHARRLHFKGGRVQRVPVLDICITCMYALTHTACADKYRSCAPCARMNMPRGVDTH